MLTSLPAHLVDHRQLWLPLLRLRAGCKLYTKGRAEDDVCLLPIVRPPLLPVWGAVAVGLEGDVLAAEVVDGVDALHLGWVWEKCGETVRGRCGRMNNRQWQGVDNPRDGTPLAYCQNYSCAALPGIGCVLQLPPSTPLRKWLL